MRASFLTASLAISFAGRVLASCNGDNCYRALEAYIRTSAPNYCSSYLASKTTAAGAFATCAPSKITSACSCLSPATTTLATSTTTSTSTTSSVCIPTTVTVLASTITESASTITEPASTITNTATVTSTTTPVVIPVCTPVLVNGGFDADPVYMDPWSVTVQDNGGDFGIRAYDPVDTTNPYYLLITDNTNDPATNPYSRVTIAQSLRTVPGVEYTISISFRFPPSSNTEHQFITVSRSSHNGPAKAIELTSSYDNQDWSTTTGTFVGFTTNDILSIDCVASTQTSGSCEIDSVVISPDPCNATPAPSIEN